MDIQELKKQLDYLEETKQLIKEQLVAKGQPVDENTTFREYVDNMNDLVDTTDANAVAENIINGQTAYVNGEKVTGTMPTTLTWFVNNAKHLSSSNLGESYGLNKLSYNSPVAMPKTNSGEIFVTIPRETLAGSLGITADVVKTGTFISGVTGTFTSDANATDDDILLDKTAYVNGQKVTGTLEIADAISIDNSGNTDTNLMLMSVSGIPSVVVGADINDLYGDKKVVEDGVGLEIIAPQSQFASVISLRADKIKSGETILGVSGKSSVVETDDATAHNGDIASGKTAYVNGSKVVGVIEDRRNSSTSIIGADVTGVNRYRVTITGTGSAITEIIDSSTSIICEITNNSLASGIGLTADKIKQGVTIIGITGTYTGSSVKEYASETAMNDDIANISEGELVKVVESGATSYFIKETIDNVPTMTKLVKESETMSPQEYSDANDIADEILGE